MTARSSSTLPPIKLDPTIAIDIEKERKTLYEKIWDMTTTRGLTEPEREKLLFRAAKLRSILNDFPKIIQESVIGAKETEE